MDEQQELPIELEELVPPNRYAMVDQGIYRGAYPVIPNFRYLSRLQLKTIISLVPEDPTTDLVKFTELASIQLIHIPIERTVPLNDAYQSISKALEVNLKNLSLVVC